MRKASAIDLDEVQRERLVKLAHSNTTAVRLARRASIVLLAADGLDNHKIGEILGVGRIQAGRWRERYAVGGLQAIEQDLPRGGRKPKIDPAEIVRLTTQTKPQGTTPWSTRTLAAVAGVSDFRQPYALDKFFGQWPRTRMAAMTLDEYTPVGFKDNFTYWIGRS